MMVFGRRLRTAQLRRGLLLVLLVGMALVNFFPIFWLVTSSLKPPAELLSKDLSGLIPSRLTLDSYRIVFSNPKFIGYFVNSIVVAVATTLIATFFASIGGYALARLRFPGSEILGRLVILTYIIPSVLIIIPLFILMVRLDLQNTLTSLILAHVTFALPFCIWMLRGYFAGLPEELAEAAMADGTTRLGAFFRIMLPLAAPGLVATAMFSFVLSWNEYLFVVVLTNSDAARTLAVGIQASYRSNDMDARLWAALMSASVVSSVPIAAVFVLLQKYLVSGLTAGALKG